MKRSPIKRKSPIKSRRKRKTYRDAEGPCRAGLPGCRGWASAPHHRVLQSQLGPDDDTNLLDLCGPCHSTIHLNVGWSKRHGLIVSSWNDPALVPVVAGCDPDVECDHDVLGEM